jgi:hypothetical protein
VLACHKDVHVGNKQRLFIQREEWRRQRISPLQVGMPAE